MVLGVLQAEFLDRVDTDGNKMLSKQELRDELRRRAREANLNPSNAVLDQLLPVPDNWKGNDDDEEIEINEYDLRRNWHKFVGGTRKVVVLGEVRKTKMPQFETTSLQPLEPKILL